MRRGPRLTWAGTTLLLTCPRTGAGPGSNDLVAFRSTDRGATFSPAVRVNDVAGSGVQLLHDLVALPGGAALAAWLDERAAKDAEEVYVSRSEDGGRSWGKNVRAYASPDRTTCECCPVTLATGPGDLVGLAFRNWLGGMRDPYLLLSRDGGRSFGAARKIGTPSWRIKACPMSGNGLAFEGEQPVVVASQMGLLALVRADGTEVPYGEGRNVALARAGDALVIAYRQARGGELAVAAIEASGRLRPLPLEGPAPGAVRDFPSLAAMPDGRMAVAFEEHLADDPPRARLAIVDPRTGPPVGSPPPKP